MRWLGRGVETYDLRLSWTTRSRNSTSAEYCGVDFDLGAERKGHGYAPRYSQACCKREICFSEGFQFASDRAKWVVNCPDYGIPQRRRQLVVVASRLGPVKFICHR